MRKGTSEEGTGLGMDEARERGEGGSERRRDGATERGEVQVGGREIEREGNFKGCTQMRTLTNIQYTLYKTTHNTVIAHETLVL